MPKQLRYQVAVSLDGFITDAAGEADWIVHDPGIDFGALYREFDTAIMGRKTYEYGKAHGATGAIPGMDVTVFSRTLPPSAGKGVRIVNDDPRDVVPALKAQSGRDIWLFGGGELFRSLLDAGLVDSVELAVMPVLLGSGTPVLPPGASAKLILGDTKTLPSGIVVLSYAVAGSAKAAPKIQFAKTNRSQKKPRRQTKKTSRRR